MLLRCLCKYAWASKHISDVIIYRNWHYWLINWTLLENIIMMIKYGWLNVHIRNNEPPALTSAKDRCTWNNGIRSICIAMHGHSLWPYHLGASINDVIFFFRIFEPFSPVIAKRKILSSCLKIFAKKCFIHIFVYDVIFIMTSLPVIRRKFFDPRPAVRLWHN